MSGEGATRAKDSRTTSRVSYRKRVSIRGEGQARGAASIHHVIAPRPQREEQPARKRTEPLRLYLTVGRTRGRSAPARITAVSVRIEQHVSACQANSDDLRGSAHCCADGVSAIMQCLYRRLVRSEQGSIRWTKQNGSTRAVAIATAAAAGPPACTSVEICKHDHDHRRPHLARDQ